VFQYEKNVLAAGQHIGVSPSISLQQQLKMIENV
jgi:hypothetical protein